MTQGGSHRPSLGPDVPCKVDTERRLENIVDNPRQWRLVGFAVVVALVAYIAHLQSEVSRLESERGRRAADPLGEGARRPAPGAPRGAGPRAITAEQRQAMIERLGGRGQSSSSPVWFATVPNNQEAAALQRALQSVFEEAGWQVRGNAPVRFPMKPGVFVFAAEEEPPDYVATAQEALEAGGVPVASSGRGYRDFSREKKRESPDWVGIEMGPEVTYVIVVGRKPEEAPGS